jgi:RNA polymerase sigma-70 factor (ECF subfamily)
MNAVSSTLAALRARANRPAPAAASAKVKPIVDRPPAKGEALARCIERIADGGDRQAFSELFAHFAPRVKSYLLRLGLTPEAAEDLAQETLLTVWRRAAAFDATKAAASTWIFTIARNLRIDAARREARRARPTDLTSLEEAPAEPDALLLDRETGWRVGAALAELPAEQAQVVTQAFFSDMAHSEIAAALGLPLGTVKSRLRLAMGRLRARLGEAP